MANSGVIKSVTSEVKAIAVDGAERVLRVGDIVLLNEQITTGEAGAVAIILPNGTELDLPQNSNILLNNNVFKQGLNATENSPVLTSAEDEVAAIQQALATDQNFDPSKLEAPAAGPAPTGEIVGNNGHTVIDVDYQNPEQTPDSGFNTIGINNNDIPILDFTGEELILSPVTATLATTVPSVQVTDHNGLAVGDNEVLEGSITAVTGNFVLDASAGVLSISVAGTDISKADLLASTTSSIDISTVKGVLSIDGYNEALGTVNYSYLPVSGAQDHSAGDNSIVDQFEITLTDVNNVTSSPDILDILIKDSVPKAFDNAEQMSQNQAWLVDNVIMNARNGGDTAIDDLLGVDGAKLQSVSFAGDTKNFLNSNDLISTSNGDLIQFDTSNGSLYIREDGQYWYNNTNTNTQGTTEVTDSFGYQLVDGDGDLSAANLTITQVLGNTNTGDVFV